VFSSFRAWYAVGVLGLVYFVAFADRLALSLLVDPIRHDLHVSDTQIGFLFGLSFAMTLVAFSIPFGWLADRVDRRILIATTAASWGVLTMLSGLAHSYSELLVCRIGIGIGEAGLSPAALSLISDLFPPQRRPVAISAYLTGGIAGATASFLLLGLLLKALAAAPDFSLPFVGVLATWRVTLILVGAPTILLAAVVALTIPEPRRADFVKGTLQEATAYLAQHARRYGGLFLAFSLMGLLSIAASAWYPTYLIRNLALPAHEAGIRFGIAAIAGGVSGSFLVPMAESAFAARRRANAVVPFGLAVVAIGSIAFLLSFQTVDIATALALFGVAHFCFIGGINLTSVEIQQTAPQNLRGQLGAIYFMCINIGGLGLGPILTATLAQHVFGGDHGIGKALVLLTALAGPVAVACLLAVGWAGTRAPQTT
jgi:MFS family permease